MAEAMTEATAKLTAKAMAKAMAVVTANSTAEVMAKGVAEAKIDQWVGSCNRQQRQQQWQSINGKLLILSGRPV
jgi:hypothetical protein